MADILPSLVAQHAWVVILILFAAAAVEYVFPPFPGDTVTLAGAVLVAAYGWSLPAVFVAVTLGSLVGAMAGFALGIWWERRWRAREGRARWAREQVDRLVEGFRKHGEAYLVINRFLPGVRAFFFVAAGLARMRPARVALFATVSAAAWNALLIAAGYAVGRNIALLESLFERYATLTWAALGLATIGLGLRWWWMKRRRNRAAQRGEPSRDHDHDSSQDPEAPF